MYVAVISFLIYDLGMHVHAATCLTHDDLRSKGNVESHTPAELEEDPLTEL